MAYKLRIIFSGLCVFAPQPVDNPTRMHVLMPDSESNLALGKGIDWHIPRLYYDAIYETGDASQAGKKFVHRKLDGWSLDLSDLDAGALDARLKGVVNARHFTNQDLASGNFGTSPGPELTSRLTFKSGSFKALCPGATWTLGSVKGIPMAHVVQWSMDVNVDKQPWALKQLGGSGEQRLPTLQPIDQGAGPEIVLAVLHVKPGEHPIQGEQLKHLSHHREDEHVRSDRMVYGFGAGDPAPHFAAYYDLFGDPTQATPIPICENEGTACSVQRFLPKGMKFQPHAKGIEMTCMVTKATDPGSAT